MLRALYDDTGPCPSGVVAALDAYAQHSATVRAAQRECRGLRRSLAALARHRAPPTARPAHALVLACARSRLCTRTAALSALAAPLQPHLQPITKELRLLADTLLSQSTDDGACAAAREKAFLLRLLYRSLAPLALAHIDATDVIHNSGLFLMRFSFSF